MSESSGIQSINPCYSPLVISPRQDRVSTTILKVCAVVPAIFSLFYYTGKALFWAGRSVAGSSSTEGSCVCDLCRNIDQQSLKEEQPPQFNAILTQLKDGNIRKDSSLFNAQTLRDFIQELRPGFHLGSQQMMPAWRSNFLVQEIVKAMQEDTSEAPWTEEALRQVTREITNACYASDAVPVESMDALFHAVCRAGQKPMIDGYLQAVGWYFRSDVARGTYRTYYQQQIEASDKSWWWQESWFKDLSQQTQQMVRESLVV